jgi:membrane protein YqaA with SNARE-associated domain
MKLFRPLYEFAMRWAAHPRAEAYLAGLSFVEAFIFPVMPEIMLAPMTLAKPARWARYATVSLVLSLAGSIVGYMLGHYAFEALRPWLVGSGLLGHLDQLVAEFRTDAVEHPWKAFWLLVAAGFVPIPMKVASWACGIVGMPMLPFLAGIAIGRGKRVYLLCGLIRLGGERAEKTIHRWIEWIGWAVIALVILLVLYWQYVH